VSEPRPVAVIVLAAGEGTRMKSRIPKVLHSLCGRSMLGHALAAAGELDPQRVVVVAGHRRDEVSAEAARHVPDVCVVVQERLGGTGHAVRIVTEALGVMPGIVVVTYGDMPLLRVRAHHQGRRRLAGRDRRGSRRHLGAAGDRRDQFRLLRL